MTEQRKGLLAMVLACTIWGLSAIYFGAVAHVPPLEVLCWRTLMSLVFFAVILLLQGRLGDLALALRGGQRGRIALAAMMISINWFGFIFSVQAGHALEASLGYYIFPLVAVVFGAVLFGEALRPAQWGAVALAALAVMVLTWGLGVPPYIALMLASTFGAYGVLKKGLDLGPVVSVAAEVSLLAPFALVGLGVMGHLWDGPTLALLVLAGPLTGGPLILFSYATRRVRLSTVGLVQYWNPTLQALVAALYFAEPVTRWHMIAFPMIWGALALYSLVAGGSGISRRFGSKSLETAPQSGVPEEE